MYKHHFLNRLLLLVIAMLTFTAVPNFGVSAALVKCRTDPIFSLSNGDIVTVTLDIAADASNVKRVSYTLHVPAGVTATSVVFTPGTIGRKEVYKIIQDSPLGIYTSESALSMLSGKGGTTVVTATMDVNFMDFQSFTGYDRDDLVITINTLTTGNTSAAAISPISVNTTDAAVSSTKATK
jgi:hypothetical protein